MDSAKFYPQKAVDKLWIKWLITLGLGFSTVLAFSSTALSTEFWTGKALEVCGLNLVIPSIHSLTMTTIFIYVYMNSEGASP